MNSIFFELRVSASCQLFDISIQTKIKELFLSSETVCLQLQHKDTLREKYSCLEVFWSAFSRIRTEYGNMRSKSPYSVQMRKNMDQRNSEQRNFLGRHTEVKAAEVRANI